MLTSCTSMLDDLRPGTDAGVHVPVLEVTPDPSDESGPGITDSEDVTSAAVPSASNVAPISVPTPSAPDDTIPSLPGVPDDQSSASGDAGADDGETSDADVTTEPYPAPGDATPPASEAPPPVLLGSTPPPGSSGVAVETHLTLDFDVAVRPGMGELRLVESHAERVVEQLAVTDARISFLGHRVTVDWAVELAYATRYVVLIDPGAIVADGDGGEASAWEAEATVAFTTIAPPALQLISTSPVNTATAVDPNANLVLTFDQPIRTGTGELELRRNDGVLVESFDAASDAVVSGNALTMDPSGVLQNQTTYYVTVGPGAVESELGAVYAGFSTSSRFSFTTAAAPPPPLVLSDTVPAAGTVNVAVDASLSLVFDKTIRAGVGAVTIVAAETGVVFESAMASDPRIAVSADTVTFTPASAFSPATRYYVTVDAGSFESLAGASFAGIANANTFYFTTRGVPLSCGSGETESPTGSCYYLYTTSSTWDQARALCSGRGTGWHLAEPRTAAEQAAVQQLVSAYTWMGASDSAQEGVWRWVSDNTQFWTGDASGEPYQAAYTRWSNQEPTGGAEHCGRLGWANDPEGWYWADAPCGHHYHTLCQGPKQ